MMRSYLLLLTRLINLRAFDPVHPCAAAPMLVQRGVEPPGLEVQPLFDCSTGAELCVQCNSVAEPVKLSNRIGSVEPVNL